MTEGNVQPKTTEKEPYKVIMPDYGDKNGNYNANIPRYATTTAAPISYKMPRQSIMKTLGIIVGVLLLVGIVGMVIVGIGGVLFSQEKEAEVTGEVIKQKDKANKASAVSDGNNIMQQIAMSDASQYASFGASSPATNTSFATISGGKLVLTLTSGNSENLPSPYQVFIPMGNISNGNRISSSGFAPGTNNWCIAVTSGTNPVSSENTAVYTATGVKGSAVQCSANGTAS